MEIANVIGTLNRHADLSQAEVDAIVAYVKSKPKFAIFQSIVKNMIEKYQHIPVHERVTLVAQFKKFFPTS
jgi:hypothetical protein